MAGLADRDCVPCKGGVAPLEIDEYAPLLEQLDAGWEVIDDHHLARTYKFKNFVEALGFVNRVGELAETQGHHPDLHLAWGRVGVEIWTHKIDGLHEADFVFAARCDRLSPRS
jgi:4a-hydroxytetrahydrobiopterin dehydratase